MNTVITPMKCSQCGASFDVNWYANYIRCQYCGTSYSVERNKSYHNFEGLFSKSKDNPIDITLSRIDSPLVDLSAFCIPSAAYHSTSKYFKIDFLKIEKEIMELLNTIAYISYLGNNKFETIINLPVQKKDVIQDRVLGYRSVHRDIIKNLHRILEKYGFLVKTYTNTYNEKFITAYLSITPTTIPFSKNTINDVYNRIMHLDSVRQIVNTVVDILNSEEEFIKEKLSEKINVRELYIGRNCVSVETWLNHNHSGRGIGYHALGMNEIHDGHIIQALAVYILNELFGQGGNRLENWSLKSIVANELTYYDPKISTGPAITIELLYVYKTEKKYNDW